MAPTGPIKSSYFSFMDLFWRSLYIVHIYKFKLKFTLFKGFFFIQSVVYGPYTGVAQGDAKGQSELFTMLYAKKIKFVFGHMSLVDAMTHMKQTR